MATKLGSAIAGAPTAKPSAASRFVSALSKARVLEPITVPVVDLPAVMTVLGAARSLDIEGEVLDAMERRKIPRDLSTQGKFELELAIRTLAEAVLESAENPVPLGSAADWGALPHEAIGALWLDYSDLRERHDPTSVALSDDEVAEIRAAISKKNSTLLQYFGARRLSAFLLTSDDPPASSPTPRSSPGDTSPEG